MTDIGARQARASQNYFVLFTFRKECLFFVMFDLKGSRSNNPGLDHLQLYYILMCTHYDLDGGLNGGLNVYYNDSNYSLSMIIAFKHYPF